MIVDVNTHNAEPVRPRRKTSPAAEKRQSARWRRRQDEMVGRIAEHAVEGGTRAMGGTALTEEAIEAYLEMLRQDLIALASKSA